MESIDFKATGECLAYIIIILISFFKVFKTSYTYLSDIFGWGEKKNKEEEEDDENKNQINVNVNSGYAYSTIPKAIQDDYKSFLYFLLEQNKILKAIHDVKSDILKEQMDYYMKHSKNIKMFAIENMIKLLEEAGITDTYFGTYFSNFENFIEVCESRCEGLYRQMCKENHFTSKSQQEFKDLVDKNITFLEGTINDLLRRRYPQKDYIKNFDKVYSLCERIRENLKDCFEFARDIAKEKETKVNTAKEGFEKQISEIIGMKYSLDI
jgi:hypothetical protein